MARFLGDAHSYKVHDLQNEQRECNTYLIEIEHREWFDTLSDAHIAGFHSCKCCIVLEAAESPPKEPA